MEADSLRVALVREVFFGEDAERRLCERLVQAREQGAELAVLPELPLDPWVPATRESRADDAEPPGGPRQHAQAGAARAAGIALIGGAIVVDPGSGRRHGTALVFDSRGELLASTRKLHLPEEPGFWETDHYEPGNEPPARVDVGGLPLGVQICSDANRPEGSHVLGAAGAECIVTPRATETATWPRWRLVLRANALTCAAWVLSVPRPAPEGGVGLGGPSVAVAPDGEVMAETEQGLCVVPIERSRVREARRAYPGYLPVRADVYAAGWTAIPASKPR